MKLNRPPHLSPWTQVPRQDVCSAALPPLQTLHGEMADPRLPDRPPGKVAMGLDQPGGDREGKPVINEVPNSTYSGKS